MYAHISAGFSALFLVPLPVIIQVMALPAGGFLVRFSNQVFVVFECPGILRKFTLSFRLVPGAR